MLNPRKVIIEQASLGLLYENGAFQRVLPAGLHRFSRFKNRGVQRRVAIVDMRERSLVIKGQEILTADKVAVRVSLLVYFRVKDPASAVHNVTSYEDFPIRTCGNSTSTRGGVETLRAVNSRLHLHCRTNIQLSSVITRLSNELSLVRKDFSESIHSAEFPANTFFTSPNSAPTGMRSFHFYFGFVATVLIAIGIIVIAVMAKMIWVLRTRVTRASEDSDRVKSALVRANLIELVTHGQDGGVAGAI